MKKELGQISFFLSKNNNNFSSVVLKDKLPEEGKNFLVREFKVKKLPVKFYCGQVISKNSDNPPWLDFVNEKINSKDNKIFFESYSKRPSGLLLIKIKSQILAATFGVRGKSWLNDENFLRDFGIKTAMNMCGNKEIRQTKSSTHATTTQNIDRQLSKPSDAYLFGLNESEFLQYISAHIEKNKNVTLQGKDNLTIKIIGKDKLSWDKLIEYGLQFIKEYEKTRYKKLFPNYPNFQDISEEKSGELDEMLTQNINSKEYSKIHLAIPEFISDDEYSFAYSNHSNKKNYRYSHLQVEHFDGKDIFLDDDIDAKKLKNKHVYAYSHEEERILEYKKWKLYDCIVAELETSNQYYILSGGVWKKVDNEFYNEVNKFIETTLQEITIPEKYHGIDISDYENSQNREDKFNNVYCEQNENALLFDKAKLRVGQGPRDKEFCDILEIENENIINIIHVKKHGGCSSINYLFSQARFYCESFLCDSNFLFDIRKYIEESNHNKASDYLNHIKINREDVHGKDYSVGLWLLYDSNKPPPNKSSLPLMAKYDLKLTYERLRYINKYNSVKLSMIPVSMANFKKG